MGDGQKALECAHCSTAMTRVNSIPGVGKHPQLDTYRCQQCGNSRTVERKVSYYIHIVTAMNIKTVYESRIESFESAMTFACSALHYGAKDVWIVDHDNKLQADLAAIMKYGGMTELLT